VSAWKKEAAESMSMLFQDKRRKDKDLKAFEEREKCLHEKVGILTMERDWLKKKSMDLGLIPGPKQ